MVPEPGVYEYAFYEERGTPVLLCAVFLWRKALSYAIVSGDSGRVDEGGDTRGVTGGFFPACETRTGNQLVNFGVIPAVRQKLGGEQSYFTGTFGKLWFVPEGGDIFVEG